MPDVLRDADVSKITDTVILEGGAFYEVQRIRDYGAFALCILFQYGKPNRKTRWLPKVRLKAKPKPGTTDERAKS